MRLLALLLLASTVAAAQTAPSQNASSPPQTSAETAAQLVVPAGTKIPLVLKHAISTKSARPGDPVYLESTFPVTQNNRMLIPAGTYVQGVIDNVRRPGRMKGRSELLMHFTTMIFPSGYTVSLPGAVEGVPGSESSQVKDREGTIQADSQKGKDAATVGGAAATGTLIGGLSRGGKGAGIGAGVGGAVGLATVLLTRGQEVRLDAGTTVEMVLQRPLTLEEDRLSNSPRELVPVNRDRRLERPAPKPPPDPR